MNDEYVRSLTQAFVWLFTKAFEHDADAPTAESSLSKQFLNAVRQDKIRSLRPASEHEGIQVGDRYVLLKSSRSQGESEITRSESGEGAQFAITDFETAYGSYLSELPVFDLMTVLKQTSLIDEVNLNDSLFNGDAGAVDGYYMLEAPCDLTGMAVIISFNVDKSDSDAPITLFNFNIDLIEEGAAKEALIDKYKKSIKEMICQEAGHRLNQITALKLQDPLTTADLAEITTIGPGMLTQLMGSLLEQKSEHILTKNMQAVSWSAKNVNEVVFTVAYQTDEFSYTYLYKKGSQEDYPNEFIWQNRESDRRILNAASEIFEVLELLAMKEILINGKLTGTINNKIALAPTGNPQKPGI